jgi:iron complex outermembrane receptor protein
MNTMAFLTRLICAVLTTLISFVASATTDDSTFDSTSELQSIKTDQTRLLSLSLVDLLDVDITSVAKKTQKVSETAAAISVITQDEIRRSSATTLPELLRLVTGLQVVQTNAHTWSISARGFNDIYASKLLVMIDGRSIYTPEFSGVSWQNQDTILEDIERIEVIRGPGGTIWGANAVNGVINIITKNAKDTQGGLLSVGAGNIDRAFGSVRYGDKLNDNTYMRVYAKSLQQKPFNNDDDWWSQRAGMRIDSDTSGSTHWMLQTETNRFEKSNYKVFTGTPDTQAAQGTHLLGNVKHEFSEDSDFFAQIYYDYAQQDLGGYSSSNDTIDIDIHQRWRANAQHEFTWGGGYRSILENSNNSAVYYYLPSSRREQIVNLFLQDEIKLSPSLKLTLGNKLENRDSMRWEAQPSARVLWAFSPQHSFWSAISRAVRTPTRLEQDSNLNLLLAAKSSDEYPIPLYGIVTGSKDVHPEKLLSHELGWRFQANKNFSVDSSIYYNEYKDLIAYAFSDIVFNPNLSSMTAPGFFKNVANAHVYGLESTVNWQATPQLRLQASYTYLRSNVYLLPEIYTIYPHNSLLFAQGLNVPHQIGLRSQWDFAPKWQWDMNLRYLSRINMPFTENFPEATSIRAYVTLDTRLAWKMRKDMELSLVGKNLLDKQHLEFTSLKGTDYLRTEVPRSAYLQLRWEFH